MKECTICGKDTDGKTGDTYICETCYKAGSGKWLEKIKKLEERNEKLYSIISWLTDGNNEQIEGEYDTGYDEFLKKEMRSVCGKKCPPEKDCEECDHIPDLANPETKKKATEYLEKTWNFGN